MLKSWLVLLCIAFGSLSYAQELFLKQLDHRTTGDNVVVKPTPDGGWIVASLDSVQLNKFDACGQIEWSKYYDLENHVCCVGNRLVVTQNNKIKILTHEISNGLRQFRVTSLDLLGNVEWSKLYSKPNLDVYPYELMENQEGDILVYYNSSPAGASLPNNLTKMDASGNIIWSNSYSFGNVWGTAIVTQDTGTLFRTGKTVFKLDKNGTVEWTSRLVNPGSYYYLTPIEVSDGYIFSQSKTGATDIGFYKFDKFGVLMWGGVLYTGIPGVPNPLRKTASDGFATVFNAFVSGQNYPVVIEFDKDLNVIKQNVLKVPNADLIVTDYAQLNSGNRLATGFVTSANDHIFHAKLDADLEMGCDSTINFQTTLEPANYNQSTHPNLSFGLNYTDQTVSVLDMTVSDLLLCGYQPVKNLDLGPDTTICLTTPLTIQNTSSDVFNSYLWSTGATTPSIEVTASDTYWVETRSSCDTNVYRDTIVVDVVDFPTPNLVSDTSLCGTNGILLDATIPNGTYLWQNGSTSPTYFATVSGAYHVDITYEKCTRRFISNVYECEEVLIPNIFTPNKDGYNDAFEIVYEGIQPYKISIYNRWGVLQFESEQRIFHWDGTVNGTPASAGVYYYILTIGDKVYKGALQLAI
ncbi:gliding motility-associated C-terminal domain-containing protein [bacterium SCSIO 12643]|nr:gliding motility-associated C-terminal domain-containing protein [bacterium SCSIO 12643]